MSGKVTIPTWLLTSLVGLLITVALASGAWAFAVNSRVAVMESQYNDINRRLIRIENKLDAMRGDEDI